KAFTEGLLFHEGYLFESTGLLGRSELRKIDIASGKIIHSRSVADMFFAEGLTLLNGELIQLSWKLGQAYVYQLETLNLIRQFPYPGDGWGITTLKNQLVISDGTSIVKFLDSSNLQLTHQLRVTDQGIDINGLNELETVDGWLYANVWPSPCIVKINPENGQVQGWLNLSLLNHATDNDWHTAMNGIAYDPKSMHLFITGKYWPSLYEIKLPLKTTHPTNELSF
ncbi:MAG: glutaminyl-peptide cyclotransferase, partial [Methylomarinum sp.]|nr:glutaminyl-peptide cyclotransferase [Methylomarinum sp.]